MTVKHNLESPSRRKVGCVLSYFYSLPHLFFFHPRHSKILSLSFPFCFKSPPPPFAILLGWGCCQQQRLLLCLHLRSLDWPSPRITSQDTDFQTGGHFLPASKTHRAFWFWPSWFLMKRSLLFEHILHCGGSYFFPSLLSRWFFLGFSLVFWSSLPCVWVWLLRASLPTSWECRRHGFPPVGIFSVPLFSPEAGLGLLSLSALVRVILFTGFDFFVFAFLNLCCSD